MIASLNRVAVSAPTLSAMVGRLSIARLPAARALHVSSVRLAYPVDKTGRPLRTFTRFSKEHFHEISSQDPTLKVPEIGRKLGDLWRALSSSEKARYADEYKVAIDSWKAAKADKK